MRVAHDSLLLSTKAVSDGLGIFCTRDTDSVRKKEGRLCNITPHHRYHSWPLGGGGGYSFVACLSHLTIDHASLSRRRGGGVVVVGLLLVILILIPGSCLTW